jgi:hypothetical protein
MWLPCMGLPMRIGARIISSSCGLGNRAWCCSPHGRSCSWPVCRNEFSSGNWLASVVGEHSYGCCVDGRLNLTCDLLWIVPLLTLLVAKSYLWVHVVIIAGDNKDILVDWFEIKLKISNKIFIFKFGLPEDGRGLSHGSAFAVATPTFCHSNYLPALVPYL